MPNLNKTTQIIRLKRGLESNVNKKAADNTGVSGELVYTTDTKQLYLHDGDMYQLVQTLNRAIIHNDNVVVHNDSIVYL
jgi:hypothetical protein